MGGLLIVWLWTVPAQAQGSAGLGGGYLQLGGLQEALGSGQPFALSASVFLDFAAGPTHVRLLGNLARVEDLTLTAFETDLFWSFPFGEVTGFLGAGTGLVALPAARLSFSLQALAGLQTELLEVALVKVTVQAMTFYLLDAGLLPGPPLVRLEVGIALPFRAAPAAPRSAGSAPTGEDQRGLALEGGPRRRAARAGRGSGPSSAPGRRTPRVRPSRG